jgi:hypothetical protein
MYSCMLDRVHILDISLYIIILLYIEQNGDSGEQGEHGTGTGTERSVYNYIQYDKLLEGLELLYII